PAPVGLEDVDAETDIPAPRQVTTAARVPMRWSVWMHRQDYVTIVPAGADEGSEGNYFRVRDDAENMLVAPAEPGLYEVRYVLQEGRRTMASAPVEVVEAELGIAAPQQVTTGAKFSVTWSASI